MKNIKNLFLLESLIFSKICISNPIIFTDSSHFNFLFGYRLSFFSLLNPFLLKTSLKTGFLALEAFIFCKYNLIIIANIEDRLLSTKFSQVCKKKNILFIKGGDVSLGSLTNRKAVNIVILTLFLTPLKSEMIQKEAAITGTPIISFSSSRISKNSSILHIGGNFGLFTIQNLILTMLTVCLEKKNESS